MIQLPRILSCALALSACTQSEALVGGATRSAVVLYDPGSGLPIRGRAFDAPFIQFAAGSDQSLLILEYDRNLAELLLVDPPFPAESVKSDRPLPMPQRALLVSEGDELEAFPIEVAVALTRPEFIGFRLPALPAAECLARGGCYDATLDADCIVPCPAPKGPEAPIPPLLPQLTPCPVGWLTKTTLLGDEDIAYCDPLPREGRGHTCETTERLHVDVCLPVGPPCNGKWPSDVPPGAAWVEPGATGDGLSASSPIGTIRDAFALSSTIALSAGRHVLDGTIYEAPLRLLGACTATTVLTGTWFIGSRAHASGLTVEGGVQARGGRLELDGVSVLVTTSAHGIYGYDGASIRASDIVVTAPGVAAGIGIDGGTLVLRSSEVRHSTARGMHTTNATVSIQDSWLIAGGNELGIRANQGTKLELKRVRADNAVTTMFDLRGRGVSASFEDVIIHGTRAELNVGIAVSEGARATLSRVTILDQVGGVNARGISLINGEVDAQDVLIKGGLVTFPNPGGQGITLHPGSFTGDRIAITAVHRAGVEAFSSEIPLSSVHLSNLVVDTVFPQDLLDSPDAVSSYVQNDLTIERARLGPAQSETPGSGVHIKRDVDQPNARIAEMRLDDVELRNFDGSGVLAIVQSRIVGARIWIHDCQSNGLRLALGRHELGDVRIERISRLSDPNRCTGSGCEGDGINLSASASLELDRFVIDDAKAAAVRVLGFAASTRLRDGLIRSPDGSTTHGLYFDVGDGEHDLEPFLQRVQFEGFARPITLPAAR